MNDTMLKGWIIFCFIFVYTVSELFSSPILYSWSWNKSKLHSWIFRRGMKNLSELYDIHVAAEWKMITINALNKWVGIWYVIFVNFVLKFKFYCNFYHCPKLEFHIKTLLKKKMGRVVPPNLTSSFNACIIYSYRLRPQSVPCFQINI